MKRLLFFWLLFLAPQTQAMIRKETVEQKELNAIQVAMGQTAAKDLISIIQAGEFSTVDQLMVRIANVQTFLGAFLIRKSFYQYLQGHLNDVQPSIKNGKKTWQDLMQFVESYASLSRK